MLAVPTDEADMREAEVLVDRLMQTKSFEITGIQQKSNELQLTVRFGGQIHQVELYPASVQLPELYRVQHFFPDVDIEALQNSKVGLGIAMEFGPDALTSYHLQLKLLHAALPQKLAVFDDSSEKILSGTWVAMAADSVVPPAPRYIYTVQAVSGDDDCVWLHTHGLSRCGLTELEILNSDKEMYQSHYSIIETMANRMLELPEPLEEGEPLYMARLSENDHLVAALLSWEHAVELYDDDMLGGKKDRRESHNENTSAIFIYPSEEDFENGKLSPVSIYNKLLADNPIYMLSTAETRRMKALAAERVDYMKQAAADSDNHVLLKLGLAVDEQYRTEDNSQEHIWFELKEILEDGSLKAELTQEPYYIEGLHAGYVGTYDCSQITDWLIYTPQRRISPDDVYLLELEERE